MKPTIYAAGNENIKGDFNVSYYVIEKDSSFLDWLGKLVMALEIKEANKVKVIVKRGEDESGNFKEDIYVKDINKMVDVHEHYSNGRDRVDIFYGKDRVYITLRKTKEAREKLAKFLLKTKDWVKIEEVKSVPAYARKKM